MAYKNHINIQHHGALTVKHSCTHTHTHTHTHTYTHTHTHTQQKEDVDGEALDSDEDDGGYNPNLPISKWNRPPGS